MVHGDLKPSNILVTQHNKIMICDFGMSRLYAENGQESQFSGIAGTPKYMPPEMLVYNQKPITAADIWSFGCLLVELFSRERVWTGLDPFSVYKHPKLGKKSFASVEKVPSFLQNLAVRCFDFDQKSRPTADELLTAFTRPPPED